MTERVGNKDREYIRAVFAEAYRRPQQQRVPYLDEACRGDATLRTEVESLLNAYEAAGGFLETPPICQGVTLDETPIAEGPGTVIGRYKLLEKIGEGGMAVVYMAEQEQPIRRKVALKIIKLGMDTRQVIARFEAERQALALMDHPSIAKVFDAGATDTGRPYFVMELVTGVSITEYCDKNNLSTKDRLALFLQVCNAVQHAHQKGIIHRDIKPSNVMVTHHDGKPVPKVIDFGIAKATNQKLTEKTLFTRYAHIIGTPAYMSPEQAELSDLDIDTRSDIYSLGVLLYELLTGTTPFSEEELRQGGYIEMQRVIREQEPAKPSTKLSTLGDTLTDIAKHRSSTPDLLRKAIRGDLDWIVMKSLEKDRAQRYEAPEALALDIQRHLEHRPVLAHAPSAGYRLHKFLRRHRAQAVAALSMSLLGGALIAVFSLWSHSRYEFAEAEAEALRHKSILSQARAQSTMTEYGAALEILEAVLGSKYVGAEARLLQDQIQKAVRGRIGDWTREIETDQQNAAAYSRRAQCYAYLGDRTSANADMRRWSAIVGAGMSSDVQLATPRDFRHVINIPFDCQIILSAERPVNEIPVMSVAFGQKGRWEMKLFEIPMFVGSLFGLGLLSGLDAPPAYADFTFGERVSLGSVNPSLDPLNDGVDCLSYDGLEMYIESLVGPGNWDLQVLRRASIDDDWGAPENLGTAVNTANVEACSSISADGLTLYFNSNRPGGYGVSDIYMTTRMTKSAPWEPAMNLGPKVSSSAAEAFPWISADGLELYFSSTRPGGYGDWDFWVTKRATRNDAWGDPVNLGPALNSPYTETGPCLSPDGLLLVFSDYFLTSSPRPGGYGSNDMWMSRRASLSAPWQLPMNLGPKMNGPDVDAWPRFSFDGRTLYFFTTSDNWQSPIIPIVDFNGDGKVDGKEVLAMAEHWGQNKSLYDIGLSPMGDGIVDANDLTVLAGHIGQDVNDPTLIAHWALEETEGMTAHDSAGSNDAMVLGNAAWQPAGGKIGGALAFDGKDDFARSGKVVLDPSKGPFSVIAWVKGGATGRVIVSQVSGTDWLYLNQYGMLTTDLKSAGRDGKSLTSDAFMIDDQWHRVVLTWDGTNRVLHMDGVEVARDTQPNLAASSGNLFIGAGKNLTPASFWSGLIDDVRVYNRAVQP